MCRMLCYLGPPVTLAELLLDPPQGLAEQAWKPRYQTHGAMNADGFGAGWYDPARSDTPALYRRAASIWSDRTFASIARLVASSAVLAAVRSATPPLPVHEFNTPPYTAGPWLFAHNGAIDGFAGEAGVRLRAMVTPRRAAAIEGSTDSEVIFALTLDALDAGVEPPDAIRQVVERIDAVASARLTMLMTDGVNAYAIARADSLFVRQGGCVTIASEPFGGDEGWERVPDGSLVEASSAGVRRESLDHRASSATAKEPA